jgi:hypothetical protein
MWTWGRRTLAGQVCGAVRAGNVVNKSKDVCVGVMALVRGETIMDETTG